MIDIATAITKPFCVAFIDGDLNGTYILPSWPRSFEAETDLDEQAGIIWSEAEGMGFKTGDHIWVEFAHVPAQVGEYGQVELSSYWEYKGINVELSALFNVEGRS